MRAIVIALSTLLLGAGTLSAASAQATTTQDPVPAATTMPSGVIQLAESNQRSAGKLGDKYLDGKAGGRYGIGGEESKIFKRNKQNEFAKT